MRQSAAERPDPTTFRKAAIAQGAALEHTGKVTIEPIPNFDLNRTIFQTLEGRLARAVMTDRVGKEVHFSGGATTEVQTAYERVRSGQALPELEAELVQFLVDECDFEVEHADGSFLDHLYFCFEYSVLHYPEVSPLVLFLHSILGTGTNTFAMKAEKIPALRTFCTDFEWAHIEAFPTILRLLYAGDLRRQLHENLSRLDTLSGLQCHRVIDNETMTLSAEDFWVALNFQLIHLVDFLPAANWTTHQNDTSFILFRDLYELLEKAGQLRATVGYTPATGPKTRTGENPSLMGRVSALIPVSVSEKMAERSIRNFSAAIDHSLDFSLSYS
jgi:hypothetical protein